MKKKGKVSLPTRGGGKEWKKIFTTLWEDKKDGAGKEETRGRDHRAGQGGKQKNTRAAWSSPLKGGEGKVRRDFNKQGTQKLWYHLGGEAVGGR